MTTCFESKMLKYDTLIFLTSEIMKSVNVERRQGTFLFLRAVHHVHVESCTVTAQRTIFNVSLFQISETFPVKMHPRICPPGHPKHSHYTQMPLIIVMRKNSYERLLCTVAFVESNTSYQHIKQTSHKEFCFFMIIQHQYFVVNTNGQSLRTNICSRNVTDCLINLSLTIVRKP